MGGQSSHLAFRFLAYLAGGQSSHLAFRFLAWPDHSQVISHFGFWLGLTRVRSSRISVFGLAGGGWWSVGSQVSSHFRFLARALWLTGCRNFGLWW